jgi:hypothetical protein
VNASGRKRGRPRVWESAEERKRAHRASRQERTELLEGLFHAMRNAWWEEPELRQTVALGADHEALQALTAHFQTRHWMHYQATKQPGPSKPRTD